MTHPDPLEHRRNMLRRAAQIVLATGLGIAFVLWLLVADTPANDVSGSVATVNSSQKHQLALQRIGGNSAVAAAQFKIWFAELWQGAQLPKTIAVLTLVLSACLGLMMLIHPADDNAER